MSIYVKNGIVELDNFDTKKMPDGEYLSVEEYAKSYGVKPATIRQWIKRGLIRSVKLSQRCYIAVGEMPKKCRLSL